jgi:hypothetical protein
VTLHDLPLYDGGPCAVALVVTLAVVRPWSCSQDASKRAIDLLTLC